MDSLSGHQKGAYCWYDMPATCFDANTFAMHSAGSAVPGKLHDWEELLTGKPPSAIFLGLCSDKVICMPGQEAEVSHEQPQWAPEGCLLLVQFSCYML
jgi:hypothetical protein